MAELSPNPNLSHYRIVSRIGADGMGEVAGVSYGIYKLTTKREKSIISFQSAIWTVPVNAGHRARLYQTNLYFGSPAISPDGKQIACYDKADPNAPPQIFIVRIDGGPPTKTFAVESNVRDSCVRWTPDGRGSVYFLTRAGVSNLWMQPINGGAPKQLTNFTNDLISSFATSLATENR